MRLAVKAPRWGYHNGRLHFYTWWRPDERHHRGLIDGKNHPQSVCGCSNPPAYADVDWVQKDQQFEYLRENLELVCPYCQEICFSEYWVATC